MTTAVQPAAPPGPVVKGSGGPPGPDHPQDTGFDRVLDQHEQARTATAEGHKKDKADADASGGSSQDQSMSRDDATSSMAMGPNATVTPSPALPVVAVVPLVVPDASLQLPAAPTVDPGAVVADPNAAAVATDGQPAADQLTGVASPAPAPVVDPAAIFAVGAAVTAAPTGTTGPAGPTAAIVPDTATVAGQLPVGAVAIDPTATATATVTATPTATGPVADAGAPVADPQTAANAPAGMPIPATPATPEPTAGTAAVPADASASAGVATPAAAASATVSDASAPPAMAPPATDATSATTEAPAAPPTPVGTPITAARLHDARALAPAPIRVPVGEAVEGLRDLMELATSRGASHARLVLHPAEFGGVEIRLRQSSQGLQATVTAEHPGALASLERGGADLRRQLEARGVTVASLEFGLSPQQDGSDARQGLNGAFGWTGSRTTGLGDEEGDDPSLFVGAVATSPNLSPTTAGSLLDVLA